MDMNKIATDLFNSLPEATKQTLIKAEALCKKLGLGEIDPLQIQIRLQQLDLRHAANQNIIIKLNDHLHSIKSQREQLDLFSNQLNTLKFQLTELKNLQNPDTIETVNLKREEYQKRLKKIPNQFEKLQALNDFCEFVEDVRDWDRLQKELAEIEELYCGLPPDIEQATIIVGRAEKELEELMQQRDQLLHQVFPNRGRRFNDY